MLCIHAIPSTSATLMRKALRSSNTRFLPSAMNSSNLAVNCDIRSRKSLKRKSIAGRESTMEGGIAENVGCATPTDAPKRFGVIVSVDIVLLVCDCRVCVSVTLRRQVNIARLVDLEVTFTHCSPHWEVV